MVKFEKVDGKHIGDIKIFTLSTCGWCKKTKNFLKDHQVAYSYVDVDLLEDDEMDEEKRFNPRSSYPTIVINGSDTIIGFDQEALEAIIIG